jgi:hypothetical protein
MPPPRSQHAFASAELPGMTQGAELWASAELGTPKGRVSGI